MKVFSFITALLLGITSATVALAEHSCPLPGKGASHGQKMMKGTHAGPHAGIKKGCVIGKLICTATKNADILGLTADQVQQLKEYKMECQKVKILDGAQLRVACLELKAMMSPDKFDLKAVKAQIRKKMALKEEMKIKKMELYQKAISVLTPEQLKKIGAMMASGTSADCPMQGGHSMKGHKGGPPMHQGSMHMCPNQ